MDKCKICNANAPFKCTACKCAAYCSVSHQKKDWQKHKIDCRPFKIEASGSLGRYLVATRDIPAKSVIFVETPLVIGPKWCLSTDKKTVPTFPCVGCFKPVPINGHQCRKCSWPVCSIECVGLNDPKYHGTECFILSICPGPSKRSDLQKLLNFYRSDVLLALRCLLLQWRYPEKWKIVMRLESHDKQRFGTHYYKEADERIVSFLDEIFLTALTDIERQMGKIILPRRDKNLLHRICGIMEVNALNIGLGFDERQEVSALFENACILEHSCVPNCYYTFDTAQHYKITMHAGRTIKKDEHLAIMYTNMLFGTQMREEHLLTNKYFICKCERCLDPTELNTNLSAMKCIGDIGKHCGGTLLPRDPIDTTTDWHCDQCDVHISNEQIEILLTNIEQEVDNLLLPSVSRIASPIITANALEQLIDKLSHLLHDNHYHMFALKHTLIQFYGHQKEFALHELSDNLLVRKIELCRQLLNVLEKLDPNSMRLTLYTGIVLYELHLAILEESRRMHDRKVNGVVSGDLCGAQFIDGKTLRAARQYVQRGKDVVALNVDISQGRKLIEAFQQAEDDLARLLESQTVSK